MIEDMFEKIDKYLNGEMSKNEQLLFKAEMANNEELSSAVNIYRAIEKEMSANEKYDAGELSLKRTLEQLSNRYFNNAAAEELFVAENQQADILKSKETNVIKEIIADEAGNTVKVRKINRGVRLTIAASIIGIIALSVILFLEKAGNSNVSFANKTADSSKKANNTDTSPVESTPATNTAQKKKGKDTTGKTGINNDILFANNFKPDKAPSDIEGPLQEAFIEYQHKRYADARKAFENPDRNLITRGEEGDDELGGFYARYYTALCYMAEKNNKKAIPELERALANSPDHLFKIKAQWYLALAYIKTNELKKAEKLLNQIASAKKSSVYKAKAQKLIDELKDLK